MVGLDQVADKNIQKLSIKKSINVKDSQKMPEKEVFLQDTQNHIDAVSKVMSFLAQVIKQRGSRHDHTKIDYFEEFYDCFKTTKEDEQAILKELSWWRKHLEERHHLNDCVPEDVNIIDVLEMIVDCVCAGLARDGVVHEITIPNIVLSNAVKNTSELLQKIIEIKE